MTWTSCRYYQLFNITCFPPIVVQAFVRCVQKELGQLRGKLTTLVTAAVDIPKYPKLALDAPAVEMFEADDFLTQNLAMPFNPDAELSNWLKRKLQVVLVYGGSGQGKTRLLLEYLFHHYAVFLVGDNYGNGGGDLLKQAVTDCNKTDLRHEWYASVVLLCAVIIRAEVVKFCMHQTWGSPALCLQLQYTANKKFQNQKCQGHQGESSLSDLETVAFSAITEEWQRLARTWHSHRFPTKLHEPLLKQLANVYKRGWPEPVPVCVDEAQVLLHEGYASQIVDADKRNTLYAFMINMVHHCGASIACSGTGVSLLQAQRAQKSSPADKNSVIKILQVATLFNFGKTVSSHRFYLILESQWYGRIAS